MREIKFRAWDNETEGTGRTHRFIKQYGGEHVLVYTEKTVSKGNADV